MAKKLQLSFSKINTYVNCPRQFRAQYVTKTYPDDNDNPYFVFGNKIHKQLEQLALFYMGKGKEPELHEDSKSARSMIKKIIDTYDSVFVEQKVSVNTDFSIVGWFDRSTYYRAVMDLIAKKSGSALLVDWKTGKVRDYDDNPLGQLHLTSAIILASQKDVDKVTSTYCFVSHRQSISRTFHRKDLDELIEPFHEIYRVIDEDEDYNPKKNRNCYFCRINPTECEFAQGG